MRRREFIGCRVALVFLQALVIIALSVKIPARLLFDIYITEPTATDEALYGIQLTQHNMKSFTIL